MIHTKMLKVLVLVVSGLVFAVTGRSCPSSWILHKGNCYGFPHGLRTWAEAMAFCRAQGGTLVEPRDASLNTWLKREVIARGMGSVWIGAIDPSKKGQFKWLSDKSILGFRDFFPDGPNDRAGVKECVCLWLPGDYQWADNNCQEKINFVCQKKPDEQPHN